MTELDSATDWDALPAARPHLEALIDAQRNPWTRPVTTGDEARYANAPDFIGLGRRALRGIPAWPAGPPPALSTRWRSSRKSPRTTVGGSTFTGLAFADSLTVDRHKSMFLRYGLGCLLVREGRCPPGALPVETLVTAVLEARATIDGS